MNNFTERENLKNLGFFSFYKGSNLHDEDFDSGINLFNKKKIQKLNSVYHTPDKLLNFGRSFLEDNFNFSIFHLNIRSANKSFEKFKDFLNGHTNSLKVIFLRETWLKDENANKNSVYQSPNYTPIHHTRNGPHKGGSVALFVHNSLNCKEKRDVSKSNDIIETLSVEIINKNKKKPRLSLVSTEHHTVMENYLKMNIKV